MVKMRKVFIYYPIENCKNSFKKHFLRHNKDANKGVFTVEPITKDNQNDFENYLEAKNANNLYQIPITMVDSYRIFANLAQLGYSNAKIINKNDTVKALLINPKNNNKVIYMNQLFHIDASDVVDVDNIIIRTLNNTMYVDNSTVDKEKVDY